MNSENSCKRILSGWHLERDMNVAKYRPPRGPAIVSTWVTPTYCVDLVASGSLMFNTMYSINSQSKVLWVGVNKEQAWVPGIPQYFGLQVEA